MVISIYEKLIYSATGTRASYRSGCREYAFHLCGWIMSLLFIILHMSRHFNLSFD